MDIKQQIEQQIGGSDVFLYMKGTPDFPMCGFSGKIVQLLRECKIQFQSFNVLENEEIRQGVKQFSQWPTIPQLYVKGEFVGGCDIAIEMFNNGELQEMARALEN